MDKTVLLSTIIYASVTAYSDGTLMFPNENVTSSVSFGGVTEYDPERPVWSSHPGSLYFH